MAIIRRFFGCNSEVFLAIIRRFFGCNLEVFPAIIRRFLGCNSEVFLAIILEVFGLNSEVFSGHTVLCSAHWVKGLLPVRFPLSSLEDQIAGSIE